MVLKSTMGRAARAAGRAAAALLVVAVCGGWASHGWAGSRSPRPTWTLREEGELHRIVVGVPDRHSARGLVEEEGDLGPAAGFAVAVAQEALRAMEEEVELVSLCGRDSEEALLSGEVDVVAPLSVVTARLDRVGFTMPIAICRAAIISRPGAEVVRQIEDLAGRRVATAGAGVGDLWCTQHGVGHEVVGTLLSALEAVKTGRADYAVTLEMAARWEMRDRRVDGLVVTPVENKSHVRAFALAVRPDDEALESVLNHGLSALRDDGRFDALYDEWAARYQPRERPAMVPQRYLDWVSGVAIALLAAAGLVQMVLLGRLAARTRVMREAQRALRESESYYRAIFEESNDAFIIFEPGGERVISVNRRACAMYGYGPEEFAGLSLAKLSLDAGSGRERIAETLANGRHNGFMTKQRRKSGEVIDVEVRASVMEYGGRRVILSVNRDVTERERAAEQLREREAEYRSITEALPALVYSYFRGDDGRTQPRFTNSQLEPWMRRFPSMSPGRSYKETILPDIHPDDVAKYEAETERARETRTKFDVEFRLRSATGAYRWVHTTLDPLPVPGGVLWQGLMLDVTDLRGAQVALRASQEALEASERRFRSMIENSRDGVMMIDGASRIIYDNGGLDRLLGYCGQELLGRPGLDLVHPEDAARVRAHVAGLLEGPGVHRVIEFRVAHRDGLWRWIESSDTNHLADPAIGAIVCNYRDITDRRETEEARRRLDAQVMQTQKLESLGVLVGGVAHDFNNLLTGVAGNTALALRLLPADDPARSCVKQIEAAAARASDLTRNMLAYAGKGRISPTPVDLPGLLRDTLGLVSSSLSRGAAVRIEHEAGLPPALCDPAQVSQVIMNLLLNASDAIGDGPGTIRVSVSLRSPGPADRREASPAGWAGEGPMLCLRVEDNGCGMTPDVRLRIFDPFFTTKFTGRGLGLAAVLGIVRGHGGAITVKSRPGEGSTFKVWLPCAARPAQPEAAPAAAAGPGRGTVLVVDDEQLVLDLIGQTLETSGFNVIKASSGADALKVLEKGDGPGVDGVLLDLTMPGMDGEAVLKRVRLLRPEMPVVLMSGYSESDVLARLAGVETKSFLQKPFRLDDLVETARGLVGAGKQRGFTTEAQRSQRRSG